MPQQGFGQQCAAVPNKLRRYARMPHMQSLACPRPHGTNACLTTHHFYLLGIQQRASPVRDDNSHSAKARIFLILALPTRESPWSKASRRTPSQERRTRRKELFRLGAEKATSCDCKTVFSSQNTQRQCCSSSLEGRSDFMSPANHTRSKEKMLPRTWRRFQCCLGWCATRGQRRNDDAQRPSHPADLKEHVHHTSWTFLFERAHQGSFMVTFKRNWPSFAVLV